MIKYFSNSNLTFQAGASATVSLKTWFYLTSLGFLNLIPFLGTIIWFVVYLWIGFHAETAPSIQNFIKLQLIFSLIGIALAAILFFAVFSLLPAMSPQFILQ